MIRKPHAKGFTLMESVIAIGIVAILLTTFLAVFGPATQGIRRAISVQEADRLTSALERELQILRPTTDGDYDTAFQKAFEWLAESGDPEKQKKGSDSLVFLYNYKARPSDAPRSDGTFYPYPETGGEAGKDYILQPTVRRSGDDELAADLEAIVGPLYYVKVKQLVFHNGSLILGTPGQIVDPHSWAPAADSDAYPEAVIAYNAQIYLMRSNTIKYVEVFDPANVEQLGRPLFSRNLAVRR